MTQEDWKYIEDRWGFSYSSIKLKVDGYDITLNVERSGMKLSMFIYVNGQFKGVDLSTTGKSIGKTEPEWTEIATRFYRTVKKRMYTAKYIKDMEKAFGKKYLKQKGYYDCFQWIKYPWWLSFSSFKRHLIKYNKSIELVKE
jgi:hypothetical protein